MRSLASSTFAESRGAGLAVLTLNIGGRNTNPLEFLLLEGDASEIGQQVIHMGQRAQGAMVDAACGPAAMPLGERALVNKILTMIYGDADHGYVDGLFRTKTWATVYEQVRREKSVSLAIQEKGCVL